MKNLILFFALIQVSFTLTAQVGINTTSPNASAMLEIASDDKGILIPRLTTANRTSMSDVQGMLVYDLNLNQFFYNDGAQWVSFLTTASTTQSGSLDIVSVSTSGNWTYTSVTFPTAFTAIPAVTITLREKVGTNNEGSNTIEQIKVVNLTVTGFQVGVYETATTTDHAIDWIAVPKS